MQTSCCGASQVLLLLFVTDPPSQSDITHNKRTGSWPDSSWRSSEPPPYLVQQPMHLRKIQMQCLGLHRVVMQFNHYTMTGICAAIRPMAPLIMAGVLISGQRMPGKRQVFTSSPAGLVPI